MHRASGRATMPEFATGGKPRLCRAAPSIAQPAMTARLDEAVTAAWEAGL